MRRLGGGAWGGNGRRVGRDGCPGGEQGPLHSPCPLSLPLARTPPKVHCTHGFNRTGYMVVCAMMRLLAATGMCVERGVRRFAQQRAPGIYKNEYIQDLFRWAVGLGAALLLLLGLGPLVGALGWGGDGRRAFGGGVALSRVLIGGNTSVTQLHFTQQTPLINLQPMLLDPPVTKTPLLTPPCD